MRLHNVGKKICRTNYEDHLEFLLPRGTERGRQKTKSFSVGVPKYSPGILFGSFFATREFRIFQPENTGLELRGAYYLLFRGSDLRILYS